MGGPYESAQDAALAFLGYDLDEDIPDGVVTWLSYSTTDGGAGTDNLPNYPNFAYFKSTFHHALLDASMWYTDLDGMTLADAADRARSDVRAALKRYKQSGQESGGGGGSTPVEPVDGFYYFPVTKTGATTTIDNYSQCVGICMNATTYDRIKSYLEEHTDVSWFVSFGRGTSSNPSVASDEGGTNFYTSAAPTFGYQSSGKNMLYGLVTPTGYNGTTNYDRLGDEYRTYDGQLYANVSSIGRRTNYATGIAGGTKVSFANVTYMYYYGRLEGTETPTPPTPDPDPTPSPVYDPPVELPEPKMYPVTDIHITNHETGDTIYDVDFSSEVDLSPVTERQDTIIRVLDQIGIDLWDFEMLVDDHFNTLFWWLRLIYDSLQGLDRSTLDLPDTSIMEHTLSDILDELEDWPSPAAPSVSVDLTTLENELEDFHIDFNSFWDELMGKLDDIIYDLEHLTVGTKRTFDPRDPPDLPLPDPETGIVPWEDVLNITALRDALTRLMTKFPFATINDIALLFTALVRPAVAPEFDLPVPNPSDWSDPYLIHVDLSVWDVPASVLRLGITLWATARVTRRTMNLWLREEGGGDA